MQYSMMSWKLCLGILLLGFLRVCIAYSYDDYFEMLLERDLEDEYDDQFHLSRRGMLDHCVAEQKACKQRVTASHRPTDPHLSELLRRCDDLARECAAAAVRTRGKTPTSAQAHKNCAICQHAIGSGRIYQGPNCNHIFHAACLAPWIGDHNHNTCPLCHRALY